MDQETKARPVEADDICPRFVRVPESLIEEPEVCEWCQFYRGGLCFADAERPEAENR